MQEISSTSVGNNRATIINCYRAPNLNSAQYHNGLGKNFQEICPIQNMSTTTIKGTLFGNMLPHLTTSVLLEGGTFYRQCAILNCHDIKKLYRNAGMLYDLNCLSRSILEGDLWWNYLDTVLFLIKIGAYISYSQLCTNEITSQQVVSIYISTIKQATLLLSPGI